MRRRNAIDNAPLERTAVATEDRRLRRFRPDQSTDDAVPDVRDAVGDVAHLGVVGDDQQGPVLALGQVAEQLEDPGADLGVEVGGRLVGEDDRRGAGQGAGDRHPLLLPAGEVAGQEAGAVGQAHRLEHAGRLRLRRPAPRALEIQGVLDVLGRRQRGKQVELLEHEPDRRPPELPAAAPAGTGPPRAPRSPPAPTSGVSMQPRIVRKVVLPEPEGPSRATISPRRRVRLAPRRTGTDSEPSRNVLTTFVASSTFIASPPGRHSPRMPEIR